MQVECSDSGLQKGFYFNVSHYVTTEEVSLQLHQEDDVSLQLKASKEETLGRNILIPDVADNFP
jgi:hypothetical protein